MRGRGPGRATGGSFLEERCPLKEAADRAGREDAGIGPARCPPSRSFPPIAARRQPPERRWEPPAAGSARLALKARGRRSPGCWKPRRGLFSAAGLRSGEAPRDGGNRSARTRCAAGPRGRALLLLVRGRCVPRRGPVEAQMGTDPIRKGELFPSHPVPPPCFWDRSPMCSRDSSLPQFTYKA